MARRRKAPPRPQIYTDLEVQMMLRSLSRRGSAGVRNRAMVAVMWRCGPRCQETLDLMPEDVDWDRMTITIARGKGGGQRTLGVDTQTLALMREWLDRRESLGVGDGSPVFCSVRSAGSQLGSAKVRDMFIRMTTKLGWTHKRCHAHGLRHTFAYNLLREGHAIDEIQKALGHACLHNTATYLDHLHPRQVVDMMQAREWTLEE